MRRPTLQRNLSGIAGDTYASRNSLSAALCGVLAACRAIDAVVSGMASNAFCAIRPPGHHAGTDGSTTKDMGVRSRQESAEEESAAAAAAAARQADSGSSANVIAAPPMLATLAATAAPSAEATAA
eukprot:1459282-Prymnesium_polylepis.1